MITAFNPNNKNFKQKLDEYIADFNATLSSFPALPAPAKKESITRAKLHKHLDEIINSAIETWLENNGQTETVVLDSTDGWRRTEQVYLDGEEDTAREEIYPALHDYISDFEF